MTAAVSLKLATISDHLATIERKILPAWETTYYRTEQISSCVKSALKLLYLEGVPGKTGEVFGSFLIESVHTDLGRIISNNFEEIQPTAFRYTLPEITKAIAALKAAIPYINPPEDLTNIRNQKLHGLSLLTGDEWCIPLIEGSAIVGKSHLEPFLGKVPNMEVDSILRLCNHTMKARFGVREAWNQVIIIPNEFVTLFPNELSSLIADYAASSWEIVSDTLFREPFIHYAPGLELTRFKYKDGVFWETTSQFPKIEAAILDYINLGRAPKMEDVWICMSPYGVIAHLKLTNPEQDVLLRAFPDAPIIHYLTAQTKQCIGKYTYMRFDALETLERFCLCFELSKKEFAPAINTSFFPVTSLVEKYKEFKEKSDSK